MPVKKFLKDAQKIQEQARRKKEEPKHGGDAHDESNWLISYADMMTLLCGFFIMLFSMAKLDDTKYEKVKEELSKQFGGKYEQPTSSELAVYLAQLVQQLGIEKETIIKADPTGVSIAFQSTVFFDTLSADVLPQGKEILDKLISAVATHQGNVSKQYKIVVEGHTDSRPILGGTFPTNWELSGARAARVVRMFLNRGFASDHLTAIGYSDTRPTAPSRTPAGAWDDQALAKNRRVVVRILEPKVESIPYPDQDAQQLPVQAQAPQGPQTPAESAPAQSQGSDGAVPVAAPANPVNTAH